MKLSVNPGIPGNSTDIQSVRVVCEDTQQAAADNLWQEHFLELYCRNKLQNDVYNQNFKEGEGVVDGEGGSSEGCLK